MKQILCFGDSNTWGFNPVDGSRFPKGTRWTSILQSRFENRDVNVIEEGLCGRTSVFEDPVRKGLNGSVILPGLLENYKPDAVVLMLGTNDCKKAFNASAEVISQGIETLINEIESYSHEIKVLLVSPILLGEGVWEEGYDTDFDQKSVDVSKELSENYRKVARRHNLFFLDAATVAISSEHDREHMDESGHRKLAERIEQELEYVIA